MLLAPGLLESLDDYRTEAARSFDVERFIRRLWEMDDRLVARGFHATSPWWREQAERFLRSKRRRWVIRAGRRAGKSSFICRLAVAWALWGPWHVPAGDLPEIPLVSVDRGEAAKRVFTINAILSALGIDHDPSKEVAKANVRGGVVFRVRSCNSRGTVGSTSIMILGDEVARWESRDDFANPAAKVIGSLSPSLATQPFGFMILSSSPWSTDDYHAEQFDIGDTETQIASYAPTWIANPSDETTEEKTHLLEPDEETWKREYLAEPSPLIDNWFGSAIDVAIERGEAPPIADGIRPVISIDPAFDPSTVDRFGWSVITTERTEETNVKGRGLRVTRVRAHAAWKPDGKPRELVKRIRAEVCEVYDPRATRWRRMQNESPHQIPMVTSVVHTDQFEGYSLAEIARDEGISLNVVPWTGGSSETSKLARFKAVRLAMLQGAFKIPNDPELVKEFRKVKGCITPKGNERIELTRDKSGHCDTVSAIVLGGSIALAMTPQEADDPGPVPGSEEALREEMAKNKRAAARRIAREDRKNPLRSLS